MDATGTPTHDMAPRSPRAAALWEDVLVTLAAARRAREDAERHMAAEPADTLDDLLAPLPHPVLMHPPPYPRCLAPDARQPGDFKGLKLQL